MTLNIKYYIAFSYIKGHVGNLYSIKCQPGSHANSM